MTSRIVVTGGAGFIGSDTVRLLLDQGHTVVVIDDLSYGYREFVDPRATFIEASLQDSAGLPRILEGADAVMHFAASSIIGRSYTDPLEYVENNVMNGTRLLEAMRLAGVAKIVFSSSASVYGEPQRIPIQEDDPKHPLQMYGATKLAFEQVLEAYHYSFGLNAVALRYFNAYGPGDLQYPVTRAVPRWIQAALSNRPLRQFWNGRQYRDYVYVRDIALAHTAVLGLSGLHFLNIGSGAGVLMADVSARLEQIVGRKLQVLDAGERRGDPMRLVADTSRIQGLLGWAPRTTLLDGLRSAVEFYELHRHVWEPRLDELG